MTYADLEKAFSMKLRGFSYAEIGRAMNYATAALFGLP